MAWPAAHTGTATVPEELPAAWLAGEGDGAAAPDAGGAAVTVVVTVTGLVNACASDPSGIDSGWQVDGPGLSYWPHGCRSGGGMLATATYTIACPES